MNERWVVLCEPETYLDAEALSAALAANGVEHQTLPHPAAREGPPATATWGLLRVRERDLPRARELADDFYGGLVASAPSGAPLPTLARGAGSRPSFALVLSLTLNVLLGVQYLTAGRVPWGDTVRDAQGRPLATYSYWPTAAFPFKSVVYDRAGEVVEVWYDAGSDGWWERGEGYHHGRLVWRSLDDDRDGVPETIVHLGPRGEPSATLSDDDRDGRTDRVRCDSPAGPVVFDIRLCRARSDAAQTDGRKEASTR